MPQTLSLTTPHNRETLNPYNLQGGYTQWDPTEPRIEPFGLMDASIHVLAAALQRVILEGIVVALTPPGPS